MLPTMIRAAIGPLAIALVFATTASAAQSDVQPAPAPLESAVRTGDKIWVSTKTGAIVKGHVATVSPATLQLRRDNRLTRLSIGDIRTIEIRYSDRVTNGIKKGMLIGLYGGTTFAAIVLANCDGFCPVPATAGLFIGGGVVIGAAAGWMIDALRSTRREVWRAPGVAPKAVVVPSAGPGLAGASLIIRW